MMEKKEIRENPKVAVNAAPKGPSDGGNFVRDLAKCLEPLDNDYGFRGYKWSQLKESTPLLKEFLNKYFTVDDDGALKIKTKEIEEGVSILGDGKYYVNANQNGLAIYGSVGDLNLRRGVCILYDYDYRTSEDKEEEFKNVKVKNEQELPKREVKAKDLITGLPEGATAEFEDGKGVDKEKEKQEVLVMLNIGEKSQAIKIIVEINNGKMKAKEKTKKPEYFRVYEASRIISEDPDSKQRPEIEKGEILGSKIGTIKCYYDSKRDKRRFKRL